MKAIFVSGVKKGGTVRSRNTPGSVLNRRHQIGLIMYHVDIYNETYTKKYMYARSCDMLSLGERGSRHTVPINPQHWLFVTAPIVYNATYIGELNHRIGNCNIIFDSSAYTLVPDNSAKTK